MREVHLERKWIRQDRIVLYCLLIVIGGNNHFKSSLVLDITLRKTWRFSPEVCVWGGVVQYNKLYSLKARKTIMMIYNDICCN